MSRQAISALVLLVMFLANFLIGAIRPTYRVTEPQDLRQHWNVQDEIFRYLSSHSAFDQANFPYSDTGRTNAAGYDTIYLPFKFADLDYFPTVTPTTVSLVAAAALSDSSFVVALFDHAGSGHSVFYHWHVEGAIQ